MPLTLAISTRIYAGFGLILALTGGLAAYSLLSADASNDAFGEYRVAARESIAFMDIASDALEARLAAMRFRAGEPGNPIETMRSRLADVEARVSTAEADGWDVKELGVIRTVAADLRSYVAAFEEAAAIDAKWRAIEAEKFFPEAKAAREGLTALATSLRATGDVGAAAQAGTAQEQFLLARIYAEKYFGKSTPENRDRVKTEIAEALTALETLAQVPLSSENAEMVASIYSRFLSLSDAFAEIVTLIEARNKLYDERLDVVGAAVTKHAIEEAHALVAHQNAIGPAIAEQFVIQEWASAFAGASAVIIGVIVAVVLGRMLSTPIRTMTDVMRRLAEGQTELIVPSRERRDEIGAMAAAVEVFRVNAVERQRLEAEAAKQTQEKLEKNRLFEEAIAAFQSSSERGLKRLVSNSAQMNAAADKLAQTARSADEEVVSASNASTETSASIQTVAAAAEELSSSIGEIARQVTNATEVVRRAATTTEQSVTMIDGLASAAQRIGDVVSLIQGIAAQTNLLALNATIEAARAGDAGKGFAVVAQEVKVLAAQTSRATEEIGGQIAEIQNATAASVEAIRTITRSMSEIDSVTASIASAIEEQGAATREISQNVQLAAHGTSQLAGSVGSVANAVKATGSTSETVQQATRDITDASAEISNDIETFFLRLRNGSHDRRSSQDPSYSGPERRASRAKVA